MIREVRLAADEEPGDGGHEVVVDPQSAHRVVGGGIDPHGVLVRVLAGDALVHLEEVAVALTDDVLAEAANGICEVQVDAIVEWADAVTLVDESLGVS